MTTSSPVCTVTTFQFDPSGALEDWTVPFHDGPMEVLCVGGAGARQGTGPNGQEDDMNRADTIALLRAPEFSQAETRKQVAALAKQVADQNKAILLLLKALNDTLNKPS